MPALSKAQRLLILADLLRHGDGVTRDDVSDALDMNLPPYSDRTNSDERTLRRYFSDMRAVGIEVIRWTEGGTIHYCARGVAA